MATNWLKMSETRTMGGKKTSHKGGKLLQPISVVPLDDSQGGKVSSFLSVSW